MSNFYLLSKITEQIHLNVSKSLFVNITISIIELSGRVIKYNESMDFVLLAELKNRSF